MKITFFQRRPFPHQFSIEKVFDGIQQFISEKVNTEKVIMPFFSSGFLSRLKNVIWGSKHQGDINHITGDVHYIALGLSKSKTILTIHDLNFLNHSNALARFVLKLFWLTLPLKKVSYVTVISEATKKDLLSHINFAEERIKVIPNYYDPSFIRLPKEFNSIKPIILQIGTKENKNVLRLIEAIDGMNVHLVIVGGNNERIKKHLHQYKVDFTWLENLSDVELIDQYKQCDIVSFVSTIEGFGMPIIEAQSIGRVVVTSNISSMPEVGGDAACYVDPFSITSIRNGFLRVMTDNVYREGLISKGFENIKRFELKSIASMYIQLYKEITAVDQ